MADLNSMIAQGAQFQAPVDPFVQYGKMQQLQHGQNQNELARYTVAKAQQEDVTRNALNQAYQSNMDPATGKINYPGVYKSLAGANAGASIPAIQKSQFEVEKEQAALTKTKQETFGLQNKALGSALITAMNDTSDAGLGRAFDMLDSQGIPTKDLRTQFAAITDPAKRLDIIKSYVSQHPEGIAAMKFVAPDPLEITRADGSKIFVDKNSNSPTFKQEVLPSQATGMTPYQTGNLDVGQERNRIAAGQLGVAQGNLNINKAGLGIRAIAADPYNISGVQAAFPIPALPVNGVPSAAAKQPSGAPVVQNVAAAMQAGLTGEDLLTHLPTTLANQIRAIGEGREPSPAARSLTTPAGRQLMSMVSAAYPSYDAKQYATMGASEKAFTSGKKGDTTRAFNVAVDHLGTLQQVSDALQNGDMRLFNQAGNFIALQTGNPAPTDFAAVKRIVADEVTKAVLGGAGALGDRKAVDDAISSASSPAQLKQVIDRYKQLMGGQLTGLEQQYTASTGKKDFRDRFLTPTTKSALGAVTAPKTGVDSGNKWLK